ncbi:hypothetical protein SETIT_5G104600v2 [Setaria italica]|uniref:Uncharacterized protein n=2 Tax=Setaria italica TaxID=4555 RepID=A0A368R3A7_SETIT|nr:uncharacterized protein LOC101757996 [Setaria italica]RCV24675.1 hypothetical protein SETIT_5G104600v2 [Setaria italica]
MAFPFPSLGGFLARRPLLVYAATWTAVAVTAVAVAAFAPELAFVWAVGPGTPLSRACQGGDGFSVGLPLDGPPWDVVCVPAGMFGRAKPDVVVPLVFAVVVVTGAVWFTTAVGVWEDDDDHDEEPASPASVEHV